LEIVRRFWHLLVVPLHAVLPLENNFILMNILLDLNFMSAGIRQGGHKGDGGDAEHKSAL
jgi:hypothetical protein